ncbi:unnamed protein product [Rotaria sp. Silwood1]|nr:unnamed protein product [Rotaria sp. Silwood1]
MYVEKEIQVFKELVDKQNRDRLWDIYLGTTLNTKDCLTRAETVRIRHIKKKLATIKRSHHLIYDTLLPSTNDIRYVRSRSDYPLDTSLLSSEVTSSYRRRSSLDQQSLDRLKEMTNKSKFYNQLPWTIRKLMIRQ